MLDMRFVRTHEQEVRQNLARRQNPAVVAFFDQLIEVDRQWRRQKEEAEKIKALRNVVSKEVNALKKSGADASEKLKQAAAIPQQIKEADAQAAELEARARTLLLKIPNMLADDVPEGKTDADNQIVRTWGKTTPKSFTPKSHVDLIESLNVADLERAAKVSGARFYYLKNELVLLDLALQRLTLDYLGKKGFSAILPPYMMQRKPYEGVTDLNDFEQVMYKIEGEDLYLIATSEHPMAAMHMDELFEESQLPLKYAGLSPCFRKEVGAHGRDTKGIFRVHQFSKVEQFVFATPQQAPKIHEELLHNAEAIFKLLEIPYRVVNICTADIGTVAKKKYDIEAWMPAQNTYREVVSCSDCASYQSTRLGIRYRKEGKFEEKEWVHTLNSTAVANPRAIVAILENHQRADGGVDIPKALQPYTGFTEIPPRKK